MSNSCIGLIKVAGIVLSIGVVRDVTTIKQGEYLYINILI